MNTREFESKKSWVQENITQNPMIAEIERFKKKFLAPGKEKVTISGAFGIAILFYIGFLIVVIHYRGDLPPLPILYAPLSLLMFGIPLTMHGCVASERERRSWDMLLVAPITPAQIILGKMMGGLYGVTIFLACFYLPIAINAAFHENFSLLRLVVGFLIVYMVAMNLVAFSIFVSTRVRRAMTALAVIIASLVIIFFMFPLLGAATEISITDLIYRMSSPYSSINALVEQELNSRSLEDESIISPILQGLIFSAFQGFLTVIFIMWSIRTIHFADNQVEFAKPVKRSKERKPAQQP